MRRPAPTGDRMIERLDRARWTVLSPYLDEALELPGDERIPWLAGLRDRDAALAADVEGLLAERDRAEADGFLGDGPAPMSTLAGQALGAYTLREPIGRGGMGSVWLAERSDGRYEGAVAVKLLNASLIGREAEQRFRREGSILARLRHPHIAHLIDAGVSAAGQPYLVLEHIDGEHLLDHCDRRRLGVDARLRLFRDVLAAVAHAHANLIVHRDLKPSNVLVDGSGVVKLLDFGVAKLLTPDGAAEPPTLTLDQGTWVTPEYAAPEQLTGGDITTATDVFALGVLLYQLLSGRHPVAGTSRDSPGALLREVLDREPARLSSAVPTDDAPDSVLRVIARGCSSDALRRALRGDLETIVAKALKKDPAERYASVVALDDDLRRHLEHVPIGARADTLTYRTAKFVRRHRAPVFLAGVLAVALAVGLGSTLWQARAAARARDVAAHQRDLALEQLERAESVNEFTGFLLGEAVPGDDPAPVRAILARAEVLAEKRYRNDPVLAVDLLVSIGDMYVERDETDNASRTLKHAYELSHALDDRRTRAHAACAWGRAVASAGEFDRALRLIDEGLAMTTEDERFDGVVTNCLLGRTAVGMQSDSAEMVSSSAREALRRLDRRPSARPLLRASALQMVAMGHRLAGQTAEADQMFARALEQLRFAGRDDSNDGAVLFNNWASNAALTSPLQALEQYRRVVDRFQGRSADAVPLPVLLNYALQLTRVARRAEARAVVERARTVARHLGNAKQLGLVDLRHAQACRELGDLASTRKSLQAAEKNVISAYPPGHRLLGSLAREQALLAEAEGRDGDAYRLLLDAHAIHEKVPDKNLTNIETLLELSRIELKRGSPAAAELLAREALALAEKFRGGTVHSGWVGQSLYAQAAARQAQGDAEGARALLSQAVEHMVPTVGDGHPTVVEARRRLGGAPLASTHPPSPAS